MTCLEHRKLILDATAGQREMWFDKQNPFTIYLDQRPEVKPDIIGDYKDLKQFADGQFELIVFDPPHLLDKWQMGSKPLAKYGVLQYETWPSDLQKAFKELWRVLAPAGVLIFKWSDHYIAAKNVIALFPVKPLFGHLTMCRARDKKKTRFSNTVWFVYKKNAVGGSIS
jgi:SAM-dependent methyltransferase